MQPSQACFDLVKSSEGCQLTAYPDNGAFSIGYGHRGVPEGTVWTQEEADSALALDLSNVAAWVTAMVKVPLTQSQFDALCDFTYNEGAGQLAKSLLLTVLNQGNYARVPLEMYRVDPETGEQHGFIFAGGQINEGLIARRKREIALWNGEQA